jgi:DNA-binding transcriptional ArsR family regulator
VPGVDDNIGAVFAALADPTRRQVVRSLSRQPDLTASRLAGELPMTRQAVTKHLAALDRAGLLTPAPLADAMRWMDDVGAEWDARLAKLAKRR